MKPRNWLIGVSHIGMVSGVGVEVLRSVLKPRQFTFR
jgi:hypothetical protein